jgi:hypothetical protein
MRLLKNFSRNVAAGCQQPDFNAISKETPPHRAGMATFDRIY